MKTNHRRGFKDDHQLQDAGMLERTRRLSGHVVRASIGNDWCGGHRGMARAKKGLKKHLNTLQRRDGRALDWYGVRNVEITEAEKKALSEWCHTLVL